MTAAVRSRKKQWRRLDTFLRKYATRYEFSRWVGLDKREGWYVLLRGLFLMLLSLICYPFPPWAWAIVLFALVLLIDSVLVSTAHAYAMTKPPSNALRFVTLTLGSFLTLIPWFTIAFAPWSSD